MKKYLLIKMIFLFAFLPLKAQDLTQTENYVYSRTYLEPITASSNTAKQIQEVEYIDGLGRSKQKVSIKTTPSGKDIVTPVEYDTNGRLIKSILPLPQQGTQNGGIYNSPNMAGAASVYGNASNYYSENKIENSPLDRIQEQASPGDAWKMSSGKTVKYTYDSNIDSEVRKFMVTTSWSNVNTISVATPVISISTENTEYASGGYYKKGTLYKNTIIDEDGNTVTTFINTKDQAILIRRNDGTQNVDTYYVYDEYGQKAFVIPPLAVQKIADAGNVITSIILDNLCYQYRYDNEGREVEKKLPGKDFEFMLYDLQDRLVGTQDANLRKQGQWLYTKYDQFGRTAITGISTGGSRTTEQSLINLQGLNNVARTETIVFTQQGMAVYYDNPENTYPKSTARVTLLSVNYYDTYPLEAPVNPETILGQSTLTSDPVLLSVNNTRTIRSTNGLSTASYVKNIEDDNWTKNYTYYDTKGRVIGTHSINHLGGYTKTDSKLDFAGQPEESYTYHLRNQGSTEVTIKERFIYDGQNRLLRHYHQVNTQPEELLAENTYNDIGQLINKKTGNTTGTPLQSIDYNYNIRGWLTRINDPANLNGKFFAYNIKYQDPTYSHVSSAKFNGNIAEIDWISVDNGKLRRYNYQYDGLERLKNGIYSEPNTTVPQNNYYNEALSYDINGNIQNLKRNRFVENLGVQLMDNLDYTYTGNRLDVVKDITGNYGGYPSSQGNLIPYDNNGNMTSHIDKGMSQIDYNYLNLPNYIQFNKEYVSHDWLNTFFVNTKYLYRADGVKLRKIHTYGSGKTNVETIEMTDYLDGIQYSNNFLSFIPTSEGYFDFKKNTYIYQYKDQVGNIRLAYYKDVSGDVKTDRVTHYYPFGLEFDGELSTSNSITPNYRYSSQGQEKQRETGWSSYRWRNYDAAIGRFFNIDPLSEKYAYQAPFNFSENKVINARELEGLEAVLINENTIEWKVKVDNKLGQDYSKTLLEDTAGVLSQNGLTVKIIEDPKALFTIELTKPVSKFTEDGIVTTNGYTVNDGNIYDGTAVSKDSPRTLAHELGHKASLPHIFGETSKVENTKENQKNLMNSDDNNKIELRDTAGTNLTTSQTNDIKNHIKITNENRERKEKEQQKLNQTPSQNGN